MRVFLQRLLRWPRRKAAVYREGWPPGVRPMFPWVEDVFQTDPELRTAYGDGCSVPDYMRMFVARNPAHWIAKAATDPSSFFYLQPKTTLA